MNKILIVSEKSWNHELLTRLQSKLPQYEFHLISKREDFTSENVQSLSPIKIFIPHWSYIIPPSIFDHYECVVFHMTDLPYGRGGSPLQNLIVRGHEKTKISALRVEAGLDTGPIYLKKELELFGTAEEIFMRANNVVEQMIIDILSDDLKPMAQQGEPTVFKRRKPEQSNLAGLDSIDRVYDFIRMLDAEGYPHAYLEADGFRYEFSRASLKADGTIIADVKIKKI